MIALTFHPSTERELDRLIEIDPIAARDPSRRDQLFEWVRSGACTSVFDDEAIVAFAIVHRHFFGNPMLELLVVAPTHRRRGIARATLATLVERHAHEVLWTSTNQSNAPMRALLEHSGFVHSGVIVGLDEGDPEHFYRFVTAAIENS